MAAQAVVDTEQCAAATEEFIARINAYIETYRLDPDLPELVELKNRAETIVRNDLKTGLNYRGVYLMRLDPYEYVQWDNGVLVIFKGSETSVLLPWNLIRYHFNSDSLDSMIKQIIVDRDGVHIHDSYGRKLVYYPASASSNMPKLAAQIVNSFTWLRVTPGDLWKAESTTFTMTDCGWKATPEPSRNTEAA